MLLFADLGEVAFFVGFILCIIGSPELYALGVPPFWTAWIFLLWQVDYCGQHGRHGWFLLCFVATSCLYRSFPSLIGGVTSFRSLGSPRACAVSLVGGIGAQEISGLVSAQECVKTSPRVNGWPLGGQSSVPGFECPKFVLAN